jgi:transposase
MNAQRQGSPGEGKEFLGKARFQRAERLQVEMQFLALDQMLPHDHQARAVWQFVEGLDLTALYDRIKAREGCAGRDPVDPRILLALWLLATIEGIGSARRLSDLCQRDMAYMWICGGVGVNHHLLSDFRTGQVELLDRLLTDSVATLLHQGLVSLERVAQDGMRVRASAGGSSFRRRTALQKCHDKARRQIEALREEQAADPAAGDRRTTAARQRAALQRAERVEKALKELAEVEEKMERRKKGSSKDARVSTTDPEARRMKMANGGFRPAYNVEFATTGESRVIVGVDVINSGSDGGQMSPMVDQIHERYGVRPEEYLADGGFSTLDDIQSLEQDGIRVYAPVKDEQKKRAAGVDPFAPRRRDSDEVAAWRQRMGTDEAKQTYRQRASTAEFPNAVCRNRGLQQFLVRGLKKAKAVALWHALAFNLTRIFGLRAAAAAT